jgi:predicted RNA-binding protein with TRAM domain
VAVDAHGDVFVTDDSRGLVVRDAPDGGGGYTRTVLDSSLSSPTAVAVDASGDVFVADTVNNRVVEETPGGSGGYTQTVVDGSVPDPTGVAVNASGDVYVIEDLDGEVVRDTPNAGGGYTQSVVDDSGLDHPLGVAVDAAGDVFIADTGNHRVVELLAPVNTAAPAITGTAQDGLVLSRSSRGSWSDAGALSYADQWERCSSAGTGCAAIPGATGTVYRATAADVGHKLELAVTATDQYGLTATATSGATGVVADPVAPAATVLPAFTGVAQKGPVLTITGRGSWTSPDQLTFSEQWERCDSTGAGCTAIAGATGFVYRVSTADYGGHEITVDVTATDQEGQQTTALATPSAVVPTPAPVEIAAPLVTGSPVDGQVLTRAATGMWSSPLALSFSGQWERCDDTGANCQAIPSATGYVYRLKAADVGHEVTLAITATDTMGQQTTASATATAVVGVPPAPVNTIVPAFSGTATQGQVLTITGRGTWTSPDTLSYGEQWERCDDTGTNCVAIPGATGFVYRLSAADVGDEVTVQVTATDQEGQTTTATATPTAIVTAALPES